MAGSVNKAILIGNVGRDPEIRTTQAGGRIANLRIATSESWRDKATGERKENTTWHTVVIFNENLGRVAEQYLKKGSKVYVEGQLQTRKWQDQSGNDRYSTEVVLQRFRGELTILDGRNDGDEREERRAPGLTNGRGSPDRQGTPNQRPPSSPMERQPSQTIGSGSRFADFDDDIPF